MTPDVLLGFLLLLAGALACAIPITLGELHEERSQEGNHGE